MKNIFCKSFSNIPSLTVGVRQMAVFISIQTNPDRERGDVAEEHKTYFHAIKTLESLTAWFVTLTVGPFRLLTNSRRYAGCILERFVSHG